MSFEFNYTVDLNKLTSLQGYLRRIIKNMDTGVPEAVYSFLNEVKGIAAERTHKISTALSASWDVKRQFNKFTLVNTSPYAMREFGRQGVKLRPIGKPPFGTPHNILPPIIDLIDSNIETVAFNALQAGLQK